MILLIFASSFLFPLSAFAQSSNSKTIPTPKTITKDFFAANGTVVLKDKVDGDAFVAGGNVSIDAPITGDLLVAGGTVHIANDIAGSVRVAGGNITISGTIGKNVSVFSGSVLLEPQSAVGGNFIAFSGSSTIFGKVAGNATIHSGNAEIGGEIGGDLDGQMGQLILSPHALVSGNVMYSSPNVAQVSTDATVSGKMEYTELKPNNNRAFSVARNSAAKGLGVLKSLFAVAGFITSFVVGFILLRLFPGFFTALAKIVHRHTLKAIGVGVLTFILVPILIFLTMITIIGIPLAISLIFLFMIFVYFAKLPVALLIGRIIFLNVDKRERRGWALFVGLLLYYIVGYIVVVGPIAKFFMVLAGVGALMMHMYSGYTKRRG